MPCSLVLHYHILRSCSDNAITLLVQDVYKNISSTIAGVVQGLNATVFAYGSTGRYMLTG